MIVNFRKTHPVHSPLNISGSAVEIVENTKFLWGAHHQRTCMDDRLHLPNQEISAETSLPMVAEMRKFYKGTIESVLTSHLTS